MQRKFNFFLAALGGYFKHRNRTLLLDYDPTFLPISKSAYESDPESVCLAIAANMLFPDSGSVRWWYTFEKKLSNMLGIAGKNPAKASHILLGLPEIVALEGEASHFASSLPGKKAETARKHGMICGLILRDFLEFSLCKTKSARLGEIIAYWADTYKNASISESTINNTILPKYKPVCHLWAAHFVNFTVNHDSAFPCNPENLLQFLSMSEEYRKLGETIKPKRSSYSFLDPSKTLKVPHHIHLHPTKLPGIKM